jgi:NitT/TauT family transport system substrate-binding protein
MGHAKNAPERNVVESSFVAFERSLFVAIKICHDKRCREDGMKQGRGRRRMFGAFGRMQAASRTTAFAAMAAMALAAMLPTLARAQQTITIGLVGSASATHWPIYSGLKKGYYAAAGIKLDMIFVPSSAALVQQLSAGSLDAALSTGIVDPLYAIDRGVPIAVVRLEIQSPPYALMAKSSIKSIKDLKGKTLMVDGPKGITKIYAERMLAANGVKANEVDLLFSGATAARFSALQSGAIDATLLLPPFNFYAESAGLSNLGLTVDSLPDLPFSGAVVNKNWAAKNGALMAKLLEVHNRSMAWFLDPANREEAIAVMVEASKQKPEDIAKAYDFLLTHKFFEPTGKVSMRKMNALLAALRELGDISAGLTVERLLLPGVTQTMD